MMPKFGNLTNPSVDILQEIKTIGEFGFDFVEIGIEGPFGKPEILLKKKKKIIQLLKKYNMFAIGHTSWWIELGSDYEPVRLGWLEESKKIIRTANELGIKLLNFHSHSRGLYMKENKTKKQILDNWIRSLKELVEYGKKYGITIILENAAEKNEIVYIKDLKYIVDRVPELRVHLDIGHAFINGGMSNVKEFIKTFRSKIEHIHIHDNHGQNDEHLPLGVASLEYEKIVKLLKKIKYNKTITVEIFTRDRDYVQFCMNKLKNLW